MVEMLMVLAILVLLMALLYPVFSRVKRKVRIFAHEIYVKANYRPGNYLGW